MKEIKSIKKLEIIEGAYHCWKDADGENGKVVESYRKQAMSATINWIEKRLC